MTNGGEHLFSFVIRILLLVIGHWDLVIEILTLGFGHLTQILN
jgi:hypothetical protein